MSSTLPIRRLGGLTTVILSAVLVAACGGSAASSAPAATTAPSAADASTAPSAGSSLATSGRIVDAANGYALTLPDGWVRLDLTDQDLAAFIGAASSMSPQLAQAMSGQIETMLSSGLVLFGLDPATGTANVNVLKLSAGGMSLDLLKQLNESQLKSAGIGTDMVSEHVTLSSGDAVHFKYSITPQGSTTPVTIEQFLLISGTDQYIVSVTGADSTTANAIADSISFL